MQILAILRRWIEILAVLYLAWQNGRRKRRALVVTRENEHFVVRYEEPARDALLRDVAAGSVLATVPFGTSASAELRRAVHNCRVIFELPAGKVVMRRITVPVQARKFLSGVVRNQVERLSPWPGGSAVHGYVTEADAADASAVSVQILIAAHAEIEAARRELDALGLPVDQIVARDPDTKGADGTVAQVMLWSQLVDVEPARLSRAVRATGVGISASVAATFLLALYALVSAALLRSESEDMAARSRVLQQQVQAGRTASSLAALPPGERLWFLKTTSISSVILIEALSRALPDSAYVNEIHLEKDDLRILGLAEDVPALLAPLERSEHMTNVHFAAPTARGPDGKLFRFAIEAHVEPRIKIEEH
jgi:general secretion pathway protein L